MSGCRYQFVSRFVSSSVVMLSDEAWGTHPPQGPTMCSGHQRQKRKRPRASISRGPEHRGRAGEAPRRRVGMGGRDQRIDSSFPAGEVSNRIETRSAVMAPDRLHTDDSFNAPAYAPVLPKKYRTPAYAESTPTPCRAILSDPGQPRLAPLATGDRAIDL